VDAILDEAICLRRREVRERDLIVCYLTREHGKLSLVAKGVRRAASRNAPLCQPCALVRIQHVAGHGLGTLTQGELLDSLYDLRADLWRSAYATYLCELADHALPEGEPHAVVHDLLRATLCGLLVAADGAALVHSCELRLLGELGWEPVLDHCARCGEAFGEEAAVYCPDAGGLLHESDHDPRDPALPVSPEVVRALRRLLRPDAYGLDLTAIHIPAAVAAGVREVTRAHLRCHLELVPKSLAFLDRLRSLDPEAT
jgi:DNA repair protein RecO (recombination protein O)